MDHARTGGTLLNQKFTPQLLHDEAGLDGLVQLVRTYFKLDGHHIQFNVVDVETLRAAQRHPEEYRDLVVRQDPEPLPGHGRRGQQGAAGLAEDLRHAGAGDLRHVGDVLEDALDLVGEVVELAHAHLLQLLV